MPLPINPQQPGGSNKTGEAGAPSFDVENTPFDAVGGLPRVRELVDHFYVHMAGDEVFGATRTLYPKELAESKEKLFEFLVGWLGGPPLYVEKRGHPRLRIRHAPFRIDETARDHWLACMTLAMNELSFNGDIRAFLESRFAHTANFLINDDNVAERAT